MADGKTRLIALLGHPVEHSLSPAIHGEAFSLLGLNYTYLAFDIKPDQIQRALDAIRLLPMRGVNLTMPLKETVIPYLDELSTESALCGSVNTIVNDDGKLVGYTTDGEGYFRSLQDFGYSITGNTMTLLGGGGAAKSIIVRAATEAVGKLYVFKRQNATYNELYDFINRVSDKTGCNIILQDYKEELIRKAVGESSLLTNATNIGMSSDELPINPDILRPDLLVSEIIYNPVVTAFMKAAKAIGCKVIGGKPMLLYQAAASFKYWTGEDMPVDKIKHIIE